jgi:CHAT domain-containing protein
MDRHSTEPDRRYSAQAFELNEKIRTLEVRESMAAGPHLKALGLREIQAELDTDTLLLEYALGEQRSVLWLVSSTSLSTYMLPPRSVLEEAAQSTHHLLAKGYQRETKVQLDLALSRLGGMLLGPVADQLGAKSLVIVPDGALQLVPFSALLVPARSGGVEPLVGNHPIVNVPSASMLAFLRRRAEERTPPSKQVAVVADPIFSPGDPRVRRSALAAKVHGTGFANLPRLTYSGHEAQTILALAESRDVFSALGFDANRQAVLGGSLRSYRLVHFATHAIMDPEHPDQSGLLLSVIDEQGRSQNGVLRVSEIDRLDLRSDLVVLSACSTATGSEIRADGMAPLVRHFLRSGATRVLVSYWNVNDQATAHLMTRFYTFLLRDGLSPAIALRQAQLATRLETRLTSPYYWAGFGLYGDWR